MNNLKRILSLALASVMVIGMMVVGASATEFTDGETIANTDAVDTLVALKVIGGYDDGSFRPEGNVTRAQMAKMIAVALHGGDEDFRGSSSGSQFADVKDGMWYTKFINYCAGEGIINGRNATTFDPEGMVTATETAVMIMRAMGYRNETFLNEKGVYSPASVDKLAEKLGLYDDTTKLTDTSVALNRQNAAQVICNAIQLPTPVYRMTYNSEGVRTWSLESTDGKTVLENAYKANIEYGILTKAEYTAKTETYTYTVDSSAEKVAPLQGTVSGNTVTGKKDAKVSTKADASALFMQRVKVVYSGNLVLSITAAGNNVLNEGVVADMKTAQNEGKTAYTALDGYEFDTEVVTGKTINYKLFNGITGKTVNAYDTYTLIDNDGDNKIDAVVVNPVTVSEVVSVSKTQVGLGVAGTAKFEGVDEIYEGIARGDWAVTAANGKGGKTVTKLEVIENVQATAQSKEGVYTIGGEAYLAVGTALNSVTLGKSYNLVALNGYVFDCTPYSTEDVAAGLDELVYAVAIGEPVEGTNALGVKNGKYVQKVQLIFANGTETAVVDVTKLAKTTDAADTKTDINDTDRKVAAKTLYTYSVNKDGSYTLAELKIENSKWNKLTQNAVAKADEGIKDAKAGSIRFNDDAVIFVAGTIDGDFAAKIVTGAEINTWDTTALEASTLYTTTQNGFPYAVTGILNVGTRKAWPGAPASSDKYGYLTADAELVYVPALEGTFAQLKIWNGTENVVRYAPKDIDLSAYTAGKMISYKENNDGTLPKDGGLTPLSPEALAVSAYAGGNDIQFVGDTSTEYNLKNTVVVYIDDADKVGAEATSIQIAGTDEYENGTEYRVNNVYVVKGDKNALTVMFVDVNNKIAVQPKAPEAHKHTFGAQVAATKGSDCQTKGNGAYYECTDCGKKYETNDVNATTVYDPTGKGLNGDHDFTGALTSIDDNDHAKKCATTGCNELDIDNKAAHSYTWDTTTDATKHVGTCDCGKTTEHAADGCTETH